MSWRRVGEKREGKAARELHYVADHVEGCLVVHGSGVFSSVFLTGLAYL